jgi:hypothetical protein
MKDGSCVSSFIGVVDIDDELSIMNRVSRLPGSVPRLTARARDSSCSALSGAQPPVTEATTESRTAEDRSEDRTDDETKISEPPNES